MQARVVAEQEREREGLPPLDEEDDEELDDEDELTEQDEFEAGIPMEVM